MPRMFLIALTGALAVAGGFVFALQPRGEARQAATLPAPAIDEVVAPGATTETAVFAGGCFWGVQGVYQHVKGVTNAVSGYAGGQKSTAEYNAVGTGRTGHAESVEVTYNPHEVSYGRLLQIFFSVAHDPTELNRQGPDVGTQYRSTIFPNSAEQERVARAYVAQLDHTRAFRAPIVTTFESGKAFFPAEDYHQDFLTLNPTYPYIVVNDLPKIEDLKRQFPTLYRAEPVLVLQAKK